MTVEGFETVGLVSSFSHLHEVVVVISLVSNNVSGSTHRNPVGVKKQQKPHPDPWFMSAEDNTSIFTIFSKIYAVSGTCLTLIAHICFTNMYGAYILIIYLGFYKGDSYLWSSFTQSHLFTQLLSLVVDFIMKIESWLFQQEPHTLTNVR